MRILVRGAGVAGLTAAYALKKHGFHVEVAEKSAAVGLGASHCAGGMLAPWCEGETADNQVVKAGQKSINWWAEAIPGLVMRKGTLVVARDRNTNELNRFASRTSHFEWLDEAGIAVLEPFLEDRYHRGLFFAEEAHTDPRAAMSRLYKRLRAMGVRFHFGEADLAEAGFDRIVDCTGKEAIADDSGLRGVRGEMLYLRTTDISLSRPVRLLHPRVPLYVVPQSGNRFIVGATMIESENEGVISARSLTELLDAAYLLHPAFGEAEVIETGAGIRPAYDDNIPRITEAGKYLTVNGMYRHGFLMAPHLAEDLLNHLLITCFLEGASQ